MAQTTRLPARRARPAGELVVMGRRCARREGGVLRETTVFSAPRWVMVLETKSLGGTSSRRGVTVTRGPRLAWALRCDEACVADVLAADLATAAAGLPDLVRLLEAAGVPYRRHGGRP